MTMLYQGDRGDLVRQLQSALNKVFGTSLAVNGQFNVMTYQAVRAFQAKYNLGVDGIVGPKTLAALRLVFTHPVLTDADYKRAGAALGVSAGTVRGVAEVEASGHGFLPDGRAKILFERHIFYRQLIIPRKAGDVVAKLTATRALIAAKEPDICSPSAGGYVGGAAEWDRLARARYYSDTAGLMSASFGLFQIMGFNAVTAGYPSVQVYAHAMAGSEGDHLDAFTGFVIANPSMKAAMQRGMWREFAAAYNGPGAVAAYSAKIAAAVAKYSGQ